MTPRQVRRAAERKSRKQERKAASGFVFSTGDAAPSPITESPLELAETPLEPLEPPPQTAKRAAVPNPPPPTLSPAQLAANRANSQLSSGPKTPQGKAASSLNAVKTALTGRTVLLPSDDAATYETHMQNFFTELQPVGFREQSLVQALAETAWRLDRIPALEMAIYAHGRIQFAQQFEQQDPTLRPGLIELHTYLAYEKQLRNLQLQEMRLRRQREKDTAELRQLQQERAQKEKENLQTAAGMYITAKQDRLPFDPAEYGFDFSVDDIESYLKGVRAARLLKTTLKQEREHVKPQTAAA